MEQLLTRTRDHHEREQTGEEVWLYATSDPGEAATSERMQFLATLAERVGVGYWHYQPLGESQDWNDAVADAKGIPRYRDIHSLPETSESAPIPSDPTGQPASDVEAGSKRRGGRGR